MKTLPTLLKLARLESSILHITLNRPAALNALNADLLSELHAVFMQARADTSVKAVLISGEGKAFCAGADIKQLAQLQAASGHEFARRGQMIFRALEELGKPSVAAIQGFALGGGCELAMSATLRIAAETAVFGQPEIKLGVIPGFGGTQRLARLVGKGRALDMCLTGRVLNATLASDWGLVTHVTSPEELLPHAQKILSELIKLPPLALQSMLKVIDQGYDLPLAEAFELEAAHFGLCCATQDKKEGVTAFLEKRPAEFCGE